MGQRPPGFAVIDVETTGLRTDWHNRVIEIGVVLLDSTGTVTGEWCSLVNPGRDLGPQRIHRISAADIRHAPPFASVARTLAGLLRGRVLAAHNLAFDLRFITYEFSRLGITVPLTLDAGLCTMERAPEFIPYAPRNLAGCCALADVPLIGHHDALVDAHAAAGLLRHYIRTAPGALLWEGLFTQATLTAPAWPDIPPPSPADHPTPDPTHTAADPESAGVAGPGAAGMAGPGGAIMTGPEGTGTARPEGTGTARAGGGSVVRAGGGGEAEYAAAGEAGSEAAEEAVAVVRRGVSAERDGHFLARMLDRLPRVGSPTGADAYLDLLDRALLDHHISPTEGDELIGLAADLGLSRSDVRTLHRDYLAALAHAALADTTDPDDAGATPGEPRAVAGEAGAIAGEAGAVAGEPRAVTGEADATAGEPRAVAGGAGAVAGEPRAVTGEADAIAGEAGAVAGEAGATAGEAGATAAEVDAVVGEGRAVVGEAGAVIGEEVRRELVAVAGLLGEPAEAVAEVLAKAESAVSLPRPRPASGDLIAFTGEVGRDAEAEREAMAERARAAGFVPHPYVTKQVRLLVAADPDTLSGKARRARAYGIPIVTVEAFERLLDRSPDQP